MASNYTSNYQLCQWEATDQVVRADFNSDNAKVDSTLAGHEERLSAAEEVTGKAFTPENYPIVLGTYTGNGAETRVIQLGFTPKAVLVMGRDGCTSAYGNGITCFGGLALPGHNVCLQSGTESLDWVKGYTVVMIVEGGFQVGYATASSIFIRSNDNGKGYRYLALK